MASNTYDIVTVGGGLAGATLAKVMAEKGVRVLVLVLEAEERLKDRVRGETMLSWGASEAKGLGIYDTLMASGAHLLPYWNSYFGGKSTGHRDLAAMTKSENPALGFYHTWMQEGMLDAAEAAGAQVIRGARVRGVNAAGELISKHVSKKAAIYFGMSIDETLDEEVKLTMIATGLKNGDALSNVAGRFRKVVPWGQTESGSSNGLDYCGSFHQRKPDEGSTTDK